MKNISKKDIAVCACEIACCLIGGTTYKILITVAKNLIKKLDQTNTTII